VRWVVLLILVPAGIWAAAKWGRRDALFILLVYAGFYSAANAAFFICDRYRYPVWPVMAVFTGGGLMASLESIRLRRWRATAFIGASMLLLSALSLHNWFGAKVPSFARDYLFRSIARYDKGHFSAALDDINRSITLDQQDVTALEHRGNILFALNRLDEAREAYEQSLRLSPGEANVWNNLGVTLDALGRTDAALQAFHRAVECKPPSNNAFLGITFIQIRSGRLDDASATLDQIAKLEPSPSAATLATRSVLERRRGNAQQADALEQEALHLDSKAVAWAIERAGTVSNH